MWPVGPEVQPVGVLPLPYTPVERPGKRRGRVDVFETPLTFPGMGGETVWGQLRRLSEQSSRELRFEFNPNKQGAAGLRMVGTFLRALGVDPLSAWVERVDVAHDLFDVPRSHFRLDVGRGLPDYRSVTRRGPQTEEYGMRPGFKRGVRLYDKRAERIDVAGIDPKREWMRLELQARAPYNRVDEPGGEAADLRLRDLHLLAWPAEPDWAVREFMRSPDSYRDQRYFALACVAHCFGTRAAETVARDILPGSGAAVVDRLRFVAWPEVEPSPRLAFDRSWGVVADQVRSPLSAGAQTEASLQLTGLLGFNKIESAGAMPAA